MSKGNTILNTAKYAENNDEFYTTYETICKEMVHYEHQFAGKRVLCNCDDPFASNFVKYFIKNFHHLRLKSLICTSFGESKTITTTSNYLDVDGKPMTTVFGYVLVIDCRADFKSVAGYIKSR